MSRLEKQLKTKYNMKTHDFINQNIGAEAYIINECRCTPEEFLEKTQLDIFDLFEYLEEGTSKEVKCECGIIKLSKINDKLVIERI